jgi:hypothetical protein
VICLANCCDVPSRKLQNRRARRRGGFQARPALGFVSRSREHEGRAFA